MKGKLHRIFTPYTHHVFFSGIVADLSYHVFSFVTDYFYSKVLKIAIKYLLSSSDDIYVDNLMADSSCYLIMYFDINYKKKTHFEFF